MFGRLSEEHCLYKKFTGVPKKAYLANRNVSILDNFWCWVVRGMRCLRISIAWLRSCIRFRSRWFALIRRHFFLVVGSARTGADSLAVDFVWRFTIFEAKKVNWIAENYRATQKSLAQIPREGCPRARMTTPLLRGAEWAIYSTPSVVFGEERWRFINKGV
jgi:hypothetical protein